MKKVWVYEIIYYSVDDEYGHRDLVNSDIFVFPSKDSAERWQKDWETVDNLKSMSGNGKLYDWYYRYDSFESSIEEKEIMEY
jgi:hypothetical protein